MGLCGSGGPVGVFGKRYFALPAMIKRAAFHLDDIIISFQKRRKTILTR